MWQICVNLILTKVEKHILEKVQSFQQVVQVKLDLYL